MKKFKTVTRNNETWYRIGKTKDKEAVWLKLPTWECDWYWSIGHITIGGAYTHFDTVFFNKGKSSYDTFKEIVVDTPLTDKEIWKLLEIMQTSYTAKEWSETVYRGGSHYTEIPKEAEIIKNESEYDRITKEVIPSLNKMLDDLLTDK